MTDQKGQDDSRPRVSYSLRPRTIQEIDALALREDLPASRLVDRLLSKILKVEKVDWKDDIYIRHSGHQIVISCNPDTLSVIRGFCRDEVEAEVRSAIEGCLLRHRAAAVGPEGD